VAVVVAVPLSVISRQQSAIGHQLLIVGCGAVALLLGTWDDFHWKLRSTAGPKFLAQALAAMVMAFGLSRVGVVPGSPVLAAALVIGAMNALNLEDGMDGVASGEALASALGFAFWLLGTGPAWAGGVALALAGALAGMLVLNWHPARVFLGDGGSHLVGALLGALAAVVVSTHGIRALGPAVLIIGLPVADTAWVIVQRLVTGRRIGAGDRSHVYDLLHRAGLSVRQTAVVCWAAQAVLVSAGLRLGCT
jgi:UDP-GlcNAc:undecaprenyl-phosphate GlcNAc-1-phosphate transferase